MPRPQAVTTIRRTQAMAAASLALLLALPTSGPARASGGDAVRRSGGCTGAATWTLKAKADDGRLEVEAEVDSRRSGQDWRWRLRHNGSTTAHGVATTSGTSHSFTVRRRVVDLNGPDTIGWRAEDLKSGQVCRGHLSS